MGFWSSVGSFFSGCASAVGGAISSIGRGISAGLRCVGSALGAIGSTLGRAISGLSSFASGALSLAGRVLGGQATAFLGAVVGVLSGPLGGILGPMVLQSMISKVIQGIHDVAKKEEIVEEEEKVEDIGYRLAEADRHTEWRQQEEFSSWKEYHAYIKQQIPDSAIDRDKIKDNALYYRLLGMTAERQAIEQKAGVTLSEDFLNEVGRSKMDSAEILAFTDVMKIFHWTPVQDYLKEKLPPREMDRIEEALLDAMERRCDGRTRPELETRLLTIREAHFDDQKLSDIYREELRTNYPEALKEAEDAKALPDFYAKKEGTV